MARAETKGIGRASVRRAVNHHAPLATKPKIWGSGPSGGSKWVGAIINPIRAVKTASAITRDFTNAIKSDTIASLGKAARATAAATLERRGVHDQLSQQ
jgi:hypothetical protein